MSFYRIFQSLVIVDHVYPIKHEKKTIAQIQLGMLHTFTYTKKLIDRADCKRNKRGDFNFPIVNIVYITSLYMEYISIFHSRYNIVELVLSIKIVLYFLIEGYC